MYLEGLNILKNQLSQCACCEKTFLVVSEEVLYCSKKCRDDHDMFKANQINIKKMPGYEPGKKEINNTFILS